VKALRILVVDDHDVVRHGVRALLESHEGWTVVGEAADGSRALALSRRLRPDVAVVDLTMSGISGLELTRRIHETSPRTEIVVLTVHESADALRQVTAAGARAFVAKSDAGRTLLEAVALAAQHENFVTPRVAALAATDPNLTARERQVLRLLAEGLHAGEVGARLGIRPKTVEAHRSSILHKLRVRSLADLVRYAVRAGIVEV
jgi:DNA-binding NarL/FixJ family response regulator